MSSWLDTFQQCETADGPVYSMIKSPCGEMTCALLTFSVSKGPGACVPELVDDGIMVRPDTR